MTCAVAVALAASGCTVTADDVAHWKETERGPRKLRDALGRSGLDAGIRAQALAALVELGMTSEALGDLDKLDAADRQKVVHEAVVRLGALAGTGNAETTRVQREAKDALFLLRDAAAADDKNRIDDLLIAWTTADLIGRATAGGHATAKILAAIGPRAAPRLTELLQPGLPQLVPAARLLGAIPDPAAHEAAAARLVAAAKQHAQPTDTMLQAIGLLPSKSATAYLLDTASHGTDQTRANALLALAQAPAHDDTEALNGALRLAADTGAPNKVRDAAFVVAEQIGPAAVPGLVKLLGDANEIVRWRAVQGALAAGKAAAVVPVLEGLPERPYKRDDLMSYVVHDLGLVGAPAIPPLEEELKSKRPISRLLAVLGLVAVGKATEAPAVEALVKDDAKPAGLPHSIGDEAKAGVVALSAKR